MSGDVVMEGKAARRRQYVAALVVTLSAFNIGIVLGFSSPTAFQMRAQLAAHNASSHVHDAPCPQRELDSFTSNQISLFVAIYSVGGLVGGLAGGRLMDRLGRKHALIASYMSSLLGWTLVSLGRSYAVLLMGRILTGVFMGISGAAANAYIGEISSKDRRGILGGFYALMLVAGILLAISAGSQLPWHRLAIVATALVFVSPTLMVLVRESPHFLLMKGAGYDVDQEIAEIMDSQYEAKKKCFTLSDLKKPHIYKPLILTGITGVVSQACGMGMVAANLASIVQSAETDLPESVCSIIAIGFEMLAAIASIFLIEKIGRKTLLVISGTVMSISHCIFGLYFYLLEAREAWTTQHLSWLPLTLLAALMIAFGIGYGPVTWILVGEMFPPEVRNTAAGLTVTLMWSTAFLTVYSYDLLNRTLGGYGLFLLYGAVNATAAVFTASFMKETKGKSLEEITNMFRQKGKYQVRSH